MCIGGKEKGGGGVWGAAQSRKRKGVEWVKQWSVWVQCISSVKQRRAPFKRTMQRTLLQQFSIEYNLEHAAGICEIIYTNHVE